MDMAVNVAHNALFFNHGQTCSAGSRTFVHEDIYEEFVKKATEQALKRIVGDPFDSATMQGPQVRPLDILESVNIFVLFKSTVFEE